ncbi:hypothetical protein FA13DRAFT_1802201 [Coprinellus micaceus]|uniref:Secreted protein n=1 Tax=Coprinellus micaceus TaxID=71717 RepID=A0A4Y7SD58_COPMI|nr:hypothetical protein FA13DRAFT_1802201 [Coprinellus micaceus]
MKFTLATVTILAAAVQASAQSLSVISTTFGGSGCPQGSGTTISVTSGAINYTPPSTFAASTGPGVPVTAGRTNCQINVNRQVLIALYHSVPAGWRFRFAQTNTPVTASTPSGNTNQVTETYFFSSAAGATGTGTTTITTTGPTTANTVYSPTNVWSSCGGNAIANINTAFRAIGKCCWKHYYCWCYQHSHRLGDLLGVPACVRRALLQQAHSRLSVRLSS